MITTSIGDSKDGPFILNCNYCMWNTLDVGIKFDKGTGIRGQLDEIANGGKPKLGTLKSPQRGTDDPARRSSLSHPPLSHTNPDDGDATVRQEKPPAKALPDSTERFNALRTFYKEQIAESSATDAGFPTSALDMAYSSPSSLQRIMNIYTNRESSLKRARQKLTIMREARTSSEGFQLTEPPQSLPEYDQTTTSSQRAFQQPSFIGDPHATSVGDLRPMPTLMRTKRSKRCATCKHILTRPELKISSARYRIKLIALSYIPFVTIKPLPVPGGLPPPGPDGRDVVLAPGKPVQFIVTLRNPLFDDVRVSLGSPSVTPGKHGHRVTILCPQFKIGKNSDAWDDALNTTTATTTATNTSSTAAAAANATATAGEQIAGKLYDQGRNWASVVIEIVPASIVRKESDDLPEDEDVIEVPIRVRLEWTVSDEDAGGTAAAAADRRRREEAEDADDGKRELSYWMVMGVGRVAC